MFELQNVQYKNIVEIQNLQIGRGITALLGPSGSGKTTLLRMLNKMISPTGGRILYNGTDTREINSVELRREVMMLSQDPVIFEGTVRDNLLIGFEFQRMKPPDERELSAILDEVGLNKTLDTPADRLSGGEKQRLALGRILLLAPEVYLLDEPSSALDSDAEDLIFRMVSERAKRESKSVIIVTHARTVAEKYADELIEMLDGKIIGRRHRNGRDY